jgi:hypothetical protein
MQDLLSLAGELQQAADKMLDESPLLDLLGELGRVIQTGSSTLGLMVYPDIDFSVQNSTPMVQKAIDLTPPVFSRLRATVLKIHDFAATKDEAASYYLGIEFPYDGRSWHIDATVGLPGPITTKPPELAKWLKELSEDKRKTILKLKKELIDAKRYAGAKSQPPYTFRSSHLYEAILKGGARSTSEVEAYFK